MRRALPVLMASPWLCLPLFPSFIVLAAVTIPGVSVIPRPVAIGLLLVMAVAVVLAGYRLLVPPRERPATVFPLIGWLCAALIAAALGLHPANAVPGLVILAMSLVWYLAMLRFYRQPGTAAAIFWAFLGSGLLASLAAIVMVWLRWPAQQYAIGHGRAIGTFVLTGELAGYLMIYLPVAYAVARDSGVAALRAVAWCGCAVGVVAFAMTFSRTGWIGLAASVAFYIFVTSGRGQRRYAIVALLVGVATVLLFFDAHHNPSENFTRLSIWQAAGDIIARFPLTGVGPFDFASAYALVRQPDGDATAFHAHSFLLTIFAEEGIVGVVAFAWVVWSFVVALRDRLAAAPPLYRRVALAVVAGLVGTFVQGLIDTISVAIFGLWIPTMALALVMAQSGLGEHVDAT